MDRREFLSTSVATAAILAAPLASFAQQRLRRVALVSPIVPVEAMTETGHVSWRGVMSELRRLGLLEGQNVVFERYSAMGRHAEYPAIGAAVAATKPDVIFVNADTVIARAAAVDPAVPVVFLVTDALASGLVSNLARPGRNLTGVNVSGGYEIEGKRMALLHEAIPTAKRLAFLNRYWGVSAGGGYGVEVYQRVIRDSARKLGLSLLPIVVDPADVTALQRAFAAMSEQGAHALQIPQNTANMLAIASIAAMSVAARLPGIAATDGFATRGGLMAHFPTPGQLAPHIARYIVRILNGERAGDLPVQQPDKYELVINVRAAKDLGLTIPPSLLLRADQVIE